ncbi:hypothetical protein MJ391_20620 [Escherichia coli]|nr:hypothetical protein MJ391_20620 [Escherichia coli]
MANWRIATRFLNPCWATLAAATASSRDAKTPISHERRRQDGVSLSLHFQQYRFHHLFNILLIHDVLPYLWKST